MLTMSDHKPVSAIFLSKIRKIDQEKYQILRENILKDLDHLEREAIPEISISSNTLDFDQVYYLLPKTQTVTVKNTGNVS
jgi:phosphatidylinositol-bisphosphatase